MYLPRRGVTKKIQSQTHTHHPLSFGSWFFFSYSRNVEVKVLSSKILPPLVKKNSLSDIRTTMSGMLLRMLLTPVPTARRL